DYTDLGNYEEVIYKKQKKNKIEFSFSSHVNYNKYFLDTISIYEKIHQEMNELKGEDSVSIDSTFLKNIHSPTKITFTLSSNLHDHSSIKTIIENESIGYIKIHILKDKAKIDFRELLCNIEFKIGDKEGIIERCASFKQGFFTLLGIELKKQCEGLYGNDFPEIYYPIAYFLLFQNYISEQIEKITFVNPITTTPQRFYFQEDKKAAYKSIDIEKFVNILGDSTLSEKDYKERINHLNKIIKNFGIAEEIQLIKDKSLPVNALNVKTKGFWSNITDVGYGVSLQLPILFQAILSEKYTKKGNTILIEQPEVHLHPNLQAKFIDTLLSIGDKNNYFIETHSEHIIRKLQVIVKSKKYKIKPEDITIHYFVRDKEKFKISSHNILSNGLLENFFPEGFYDTSYNLVKELL
ncbi:DUF3696 domain-containing protein, partial [Chryseobacterium sp. 2TAF14]|uniref:AAA family ATPase n=1 Tax=Chryseobacterium sp. 2TAF14 TaxID=3233007 RepID=UPI003F918DD3